MRVLCIWWPQLAIERWAKTRGSDCAPDKPVVLTLEAAHGPVISALTQAAVERGARAGARLTDARALDPALLAVPADPDGDAALVRRLARWAQRWSPLVEVDGDGPSTALGTGLRLEVGGSAHLFGGEAALAADVQERFARLGLSTRVAIAPTAGAAWALSRYGPSSRSLCGRDVAALLAPLPVAALRLGPQSVRTLERLGLKTIGALAGIERRSLARRFREAAAKNGSSPNEPGFLQPLDGLDRALGRRPEPLTGTRVDPPPRATLRLAEPVPDPAILGQALARLAGPLAEELGRRRLGARRIAFEAFRIDGELGEAVAETALPTRDPAHIVRLLAEKLDALDPGFGFDGFALTARWCEPLDAAQDALLGEPRREVELARLIDRLVARLGRERVRRPKRRESHLPEVASGWEEAAGSSLSRSDGEGDHGAHRHGGGVRAKPLHPSTSSSGPPPRPEAGDDLQRPQRLLDSPEAIAVVYATPEGVPRRFVWRRGVHDIARVEGPERIAPEWWRQPAATRLRDYYRVEDREGRRYWIYREGLAGDGRGGAPAWFIHGLFG